MNNTSSELSTNIKSISKSGKLTKEETMLRSYNETFYSSLKNLSFIKDPLPLEEKLMYHFEQNDSASVSSTIGQLESTLEELLVKNKEIKEKINLKRNHKTKKETLTPTRKKKKIVKKPG